MFDGVFSILIGFAALAFVLLLFSIPARLRRKRMQQHGVQATAFVRNVVDLHSTNRGRPHVRYDVTITLPAGEPYDASKEVRVFPMDSPAANIGQRFPVIVDPRNPQYFEFPHTQQP